MSRITRYVYAAFAAAFAVTAVAILALFLVVDGATRIDDFVRSGREDLVGHVLRYYLLHLPLIFVQIGPVVTLVATAFALGRLQRQGELLPVFASGVSLARVLRPVVATAVLLAGVSLAIEQWVVPRAVEEIQARTLSDRRERFLFNVLARDPRGGTLLFCGKYTPATTEGENVHVLELGPDPATGGTPAADARRLRGRVFAWTARYVEGSGWVLRDGYRLAYDAEGRREGSGAPVPFDALTYPRLQLRPYDVEHEGEAGQARSLTSLAREAARAPELPGLRLELHGRLAHGFAHLALLLAGLPLVLRRESRSVVVGPLLGGGCCAVYFGLQAVATDVGARGLCAPALAAWAPIAILVAIGIAWWDSLPS